MERARLEEENRKNSNEQEENKVKEEVYSDEVDKKVKRLNFGKVDVSKWQGHGDEKNAEQSKYSFQEEARKTKLQPKQKKTVHMEQPKEELIETETLKLVEKSSAKNELAIGDEYEAKIKQQNIYRLDKNTLNFEREERIKREREEMEFLRQEEIQRHVMANDDPEEKIEDSDEDEYDKKVKKKSIGRLNMENSIFSVAEKREEISVKPKLQTTQKIALQEEPPREEVIKAESAPDPVQQAPSESETVEDDYEVKIKQKNVNKLDKKAFAFEQTSDNVRWRQLGEDRIKCEQEELEFLRQEEIRRRDMAKNDPEEEMEDSDEDEYDKKVKKKNVGRLDMENSIFSVAEKREEIFVKPKSQTTQKIALLEEPLREEVIKAESAPDPVQQTSAESEPVEDEYEVKIKQRNINRLDKKAFSFEQTSDDVRWRQLGEDRIKCEQEELEFLRQEEIRRRDMANDDPEEKVEDSDEDEYDKKVKKKSVGRLDMENSIFSVAEKREKISVKPKTQTTQTIALQEEHPREDLIETKSVPDPVEQTPLESEPVEDEYEVKIRQKIINKLDENCLTFRQTPDDVRLKQIEEERIKRELDEMELLRQEEMRRHVMANDDPKEKVEDSDEDEYDKKVQKKNVGRLDMENSIFSVAEKRENISVKPKSQKTQKIPLREELPREDLIETKSAPDPLQQTPLESEPIEDEYEVKIKQRNINRLDKKAFTFEQTSDYVRWRQLGEDRIKYEQEELEFLRQEEIRRRDMAKNDREEKVEDSDEDEYDKKVKKRNVGRLDMENSIFSVAEKRENISVKPKSQKTQKIPLREGLPREDLIETKSAPDPVQQTPLESEPVEDEYEVKIRQKIINKLDENCLTFRQTPDDVRLKQIEEERIKRELDEMEFLRQEEMRRHVIAESEPVESTEDIDEDEYERKVKKKSVGRLNLKCSIFNATDEQEKMFIMSEPKQKITLEKERQRQAMIEKEKTIEPAQQNVVEIRPLERTPFEVQLEEEEEYEVKVKQRAVNKLDRNRLNFEKSTDDTKRKQLEKETRRQETEEIQFPKQEEVKRHAFIETKKKHQIEKNSCRGTEVETPSEKFNKEEKPRVGKLNLNWMNVISGETKNDTNERPESALSQEKPEPSPEVDIIAAKEIEDVECTPTMTWYNEDAAFEEKRKNEGVKPLDFSKFVVSTNMDMEERKRRKLELERERQRIEREEIEQQRRLLKVTPEDELTFDKNGYQKTSTNFMKESSNANKQSERLSGTNRVESMNGFSEKERESKEIKRQGKIELGIWADIDNSAMVRKQKSPNRNSVVDGKQDVPESSHTRYFASCKLGII